MRSQDDEFGFVDDDSSGAPPESSSAPSGRLGSHTPQLPLQHSVMPRHAPWFESPPSARLFSAVPLTLGRSPPSSGSSSVSGPRRGATKRRSRTKEEICARMLRSAAPAQAAVEFALYIAAADRPFCELKQDKRMREPLGMRGTAVAAATANQQAQDLMPQEPPRAAPPGSDTWMLREPRHTWTSQHNQVRIQTHACHRAPPVLTSRLSLHWGCDSVWRKQH